MATQDGTQILFSAAHERQAFKLLELPSELLELLESADPPILHLKNAVSSTGPAYALLTTPSKTYRIQQKNSSNPIMILQPSTSAASSSADDTETMSDIPQASVCSIATIEDTLELLPEHEEKKVEKKVNKWHEKFAKSRTSSKG